MKRRYHWVLSGNFWRLKGNCCPIYSHAFVAVDGSADFWLDCYSIDQRDTISVDYDSVEEAKEDICGLFTSLS